jgi:hypothetical protein
MRSTKNVLSIGIVALLALAPACKSKEKEAADQRVKEGLAKVAEGANEFPPDFEIAVKRVVTASTLAPNQVFAEQGLGLEAEAGKVFACVQYTIKNAGNAPASPAQPVLVDAGGVEHEVSVEAAGKLPTEWEQNFGLDKIEPGESQGGYRCYQVPADSVGGSMKLRFQDKGWGGKGAWEQVLDLPAPVSASSESGDESAEE